MPNRPTLDEIFSSPAPTAAKGRPSLDDIFSEPAVAAPVDRGVADAAVRHGLKGLTLGFDDELGGGIGALADKIGGSSTPLVDLYTKHRDDLRKKADEARAAHPWVSGAANIVGSIPTLAATGGVTGLGALGEAAAGGAVMGLGDSNADLTKGDVGGAVKDAAVGGLVGGATHKVLGGIGKYLSPDSTAEMAEDLAVKHLRPTAKVREKLGQEGLRDVGREALDSGAIGFGQKVDKTAANLANLRDEVGAVKGDITNASDAEIDPRDIADKFDKNVISQFRGTSENKPIVKMLEGKRDAFLKQYAGSVEPPSRAPGSPTTITRKSQYIPADPTVPFEQGTQQIGEIRTPRIHVDSVKQQIGETRTPNVEVQNVPTDLPYEPHSLVTPGKGTETRVFNTGETVTPEMGEQMRIFHTGEDVTPVKGYITPEASPAFKTDPKTGLPAKQIVEKRLEATPEAPMMSPAQVEAEKTAVNGKINYKADSNAKINAMKGWANTLKTSAEDAIQDPAFQASKESYGNLAAGAKMASKTASLVDGGGLMSHISDVGAMTAGVGGALATGNPLPLILPAARALTKGRVASAGAVGLDKLSQVMRATPEKFGSYYPMLQAAAQRGPQALAVQHFVLSQRDPKYQQMMNDISGQSDK